MMDYDKIVRSDGKILKRGDLVRIYKDPITRQHIEGNARLISLWSDHESLWTVRFVDKEFNLVRYVSWDDLIEEGDK